MAIKNVWSKSISDVARLGGGQCTWGVDNDDDEFRGTVVALNRLHLVLLRVFRRRIYRTVHPVYQCVKCAHTILDTTLNGICNCICDPVSEVLRHCYNAIHNC